MDTQTVYFDHSIWAHPPSAARAEELIRAHPVRLAVSEWNLYEIAKGSDRVQAQHRAALLDQLRPYWIAEALSLKRQEVRAYVWREFLGHSNPPIVFHDHLSVLRSAVVGASVLLGYTAEKALKEWFAFPGALRDVAAAARATPAALRINQTTSRKQRRENDAEITRRWVTGLMPVAGPDGRALLRVQREAFGERIVSGKTHFLSQCPAMAVEEHLCEVRARDTKRRPNDQDAADLAHAVPSLAYCTHFVARDGFLLQCARFAARSMATAQVHDTVDSLAVALEGSPVVKTCGDPRLGRHASR
jgi:hypothetical protein